MDPAFDGLLPSSLLGPIPAAAEEVEGDLGATHGEIGEGHVKTHGGRLREEQATLHREALVLYWLREREDVPRLIRVDFENRRILTARVVGPCSFGKETIPHHTGHIRRNTVRPHVVGRVAVGFSWASTPRGTIHELSQFVGKVGCPWHPGLDPCRRVFSGGGLPCTRAPLPLVRTPPKRVALVLRGIGAATDTPSLWKSAAKPVQVGWRPAYGHLSKLVEGSAPDLFCHVWAGEGQAEEIAALSKAYRPLKLAAEPLSTSFEEDFRPLSDPDDPSRSEWSRHPSVLQRTWSTLTSIQRAVGLVEDLDSYDLVAVSRLDFLPPSWLDLRRLDPKKFTVLMGQNPRGLFQGRAPGGIHDWFVAGPPAAIRAYSNLIRSLPRILGDRTAPGVTKSPHYQLIDELAREWGGEIVCLHSTHLAKAPTRSVGCVYGMCSGSYCCNPPSKLTIWRVKVGVEGPIPRQTLIKIQALRSLSCTPLSIDGEWVVFSCPPDYDFPGICRSVTAGLFVPSPAPPSVAKKWLPAREPAPTGRD